MTVGSATVGTLGEDFLVNNVSLYTYAYSIWTMAGIDQAPPVVGDNVSMPYINGRIWVPKSFDQRTLTLGMWVKATDENGNVPTGYASTAIARRSQFNSNMQTLKQLFLPRQFSSIAVAQPLNLTRKRQYLGGLQTHTASGDAYNPSSGGEMSGSSGGNLGTDLFDLDPVTPFYGTFTVDIVMADPWWYGSPVTVTLTGITSGNFVQNTGADTVCTNMSITFACPSGANAPLVNPVLTNFLYNGSNSISVGLTASIPAGQSCTLHLPQFTIGGLGGFVPNLNMVGYSGSLYWMELWPGINVNYLNFSAASGPTNAGHLATCSAEYYPPFS